MPELLSIEVAIFLCGTFAAAFVTSLSGFAFAMVAARSGFMRFHRRKRTPSSPPMRSSSRGMLCGSYDACLIHIALCHSSWAARWEFLWALRLYAGLHRFISGSAWACCCLFSLYNLTRPQLPQMKQAGRAADGAVGVLNGIIGGATGLAGIVTVIWTSMRGWSRDEQRAVFQRPALQAFL
jgi:hypothetical protein